jgi:hypothetical protein
MIFLHITPDAKNSHLLNKYIKEGKNVFALVYMDGCGPCNITRPEWAKLKTILETRYKELKNVVIADINSNSLKDMHYIKNIKGFPTILFICKKGHHKEEFENGKQKNKTRTSDAFIEWIELNIKPYSHGNKTRRKTITRKNKSHKRRINKRNTTLKQ